jgi:serine/threonine protein kinase
MMRPIVLLTCNNHQGMGRIKAQYYLEYTGAEVHQAALFHMRLAEPQPNTGVLLVPQVGTQRWILPTQRLYETGVRPGDTICIIPLVDRPSTWQDAQPSRKPQQKPVPQPPGPSPRSGPGFKPSCTGVPFPKFQAFGKTLDQLVVRLADFPKIRDIGRSSFGQSYSARDPRTGGEVAVKVIESDFREEDEKVSFRRKVQLLASVDHPTLLGFRGWVPPHSSSPPAILTEYMSRGSLAAMIEAETKHTAPPQWDATRKFIALYGTAIGMLILHMNRVLHRDVNPENVLLNN